MEDELEEGRRRSTELYREYRRKLIYYAYASLHDTAAAEEAVQETFRIVCEKYDQLPQIKRPFAWLIQILSNVMRNGMEERKRWYDMLFYDWNTSAEHHTAVEDEPDVEVLYRGLIPDQDLHLLKLVAVDRCTYIEVAKEYHISPDACRKRVKRAAEALRKRLEEQGL